VTIEGVRIDELDLLTNCSHHSKLHFTVHWHTLVSSVYYSPHYPFLATDFNTGTITVSLNYTPRIWRYYSTRKVFSSQRDCQLDSAPSSQTFLQSSTVDSLLIWNCRTRLPITNRTHFITTLHRPNRQHCSQQFLYCCLCIRCRGNSFTEPLPSNGRLLYSGLQSSCHIIKLNSSFSRHVSKFTLSSSDHSS
jgi:hypothetical protein